MNKNAFAMGGICLLVVLIGHASVSAEDISSQGKRRRDPFVALVSAEGKIKTFSELFPIVKEKPLSMNIAIKAIIWTTRGPWH